MRGSVMWFCEAKICNPYSVESSGYDLIFHCPSWTFEYMNWQVFIYKISVCGTSNRVMSQCHVTELWTIMRRKKTSRILKVRVWAWYIAACHIKSLLSVVTSQILSNSLEPEGELTDNVKLSGIGLLSVIPNDVLIKMYTSKTSWSQATTWYSSCGVII